MTRKSLCMVWKFSSHVLTCKTITNDGGHLAPFSRGNLNG
jgi:hypothetical protein